MIDPFYNSILAAIVILWLLSLRSIKMGRVIRVLRRWSPVLTLCFWIAFVCFVGWYLLNYDYFGEIHDIDDAVDTALSSMSNGINPYEEYVVPRFKGKFSPDVVWTLGPYNYMPLDLLTYAAARDVFGALGFPTWFVVTNLIFSGIAMILMRELTRVSCLTFIPVAGIVMLFYSMDNASLTLMLMIGSLYALERSSYRPETLALILMGLAVLTKVYAAIPFLVMLLYVLQLRASRRDWRGIAETFLATGVIAAAAILMILPFGISNVLDAAVFFHTSEDARAGTSAGGTVLAELAMSSPYFSLIGVSITAAAVFAGLWLRNLNDRVMLVIVTFLLIAVKSSLAPLTVAGVFLALRIRELADERAASLSRTDPHGSADESRAPAEGALSND